MSWKESSQFMLYLHQETAKALLVSKDLHGDHKNSYSAVWLPKSQVVEISRRNTVRDGEQVLVEIPQWLAQKIGLDASLDGEDDLVEPL